MLECEILGILKVQLPGHGGEIQLADAINIRASQCHMRAVTLNGQRYDCGSKMGYLEAVMDFAFQHPDYSELYGTLVDNQVAVRRDRAAE